MGRPPHDPHREGWGHSSNALWSYTLHYHGWLGAPALDPALARATISGWIDEHPRGVGWEPYPTSMRLLHWIGWLHRHGATLQAFEREKVFESIAAQLEHLAAHIETHIDGNHLWTNLVALTCGGLALRGPLPERLVERFGPRLIATVREQLAGDGVHGERTPSYHCLLAEQLAVVLSFARSQRPRLHDALVPALEAMLSAMPAFTHPDGDVALWGDSQRDGPVTPAGLLGRLRRAPPRGHADAVISGFSRRRWGPFTLLWNRGDVGLPHQVGHVHGDALAIELSLGSTRFLVDAGVGTYEIGAERRYARSTAAHNTVTVGPGAADQHELWASHRIGARARPETIACAEHRLVGRVRGHASASTHRRDIEHDERQPGIVRITDTIEDRPGSGVARYFVPADCPLTVDHDTVWIEVEGHRVRLRAPGRRWRSNPAPGWLGMGRPAARICLAVPVDAGGTQVELSALSTRLRPCP